MSLFYYALGDIHGRDDLLEALHEQIIVYHKFQNGSAPGIIIHIGDYIDGGSNSISVIDRLMAGLSDFQTICLKGNHEDMMLQCLETDDRQVWHTWLHNGGEETLSSLGLSFRFGGYDPQLLRDALGEKRIQWLQSLPLYHRVDDYLFVHAGIMPGKPIEMQSEKDLLWIRNRFLENQDDQGFLVIHGHTPSDQPVVRPNRICVDTGATSNGQLTAVVLSVEATPRFLSVEGKPGKGPEKF